MYLVGTTKCTILLHCYFTRDIVIQDIYVFSGTWNYSIKGAKRREELKESDFRRKLKNHALIGIYSNVIPLKFRVHGF